MKKLERLKSDLIRQGIISGGITAVLLGAMLFVMSIEQEYTDERQLLTRQINQVNADIQQLDSRFKKARQSLDLYEQLRSSSDNADEALSRKEITAILNILKDKYKLSTLTLRMTPMIELADQKYVTPTTSVAKTELTMTFSGMTDELLLGFVKDLQELLPGYSRIIFLEMERTGSIDNQFLMAVNRETYPALVQGEVTLQLMGLTKKPVEDATRG